MSAFKDKFFKLSSPIIGLLSFSQLRKLSGIKRIVPVYHAVADETPEHLRHLYSLKSISDFTKDLECLLKYYNPIDIHQLIKQVESGEEIQKPVFHLTFDDGLSEFHQNVAPILLQKGIPATCFLNNAFIDNENMLFRLKASLLIDHLHNQSAGSASWTKFHEWIQKYNFGSLYYRKLLLGLKYEDTAKIDELAELLGVDFSDFLKTSKPYMSSDQINELKQQGFTFGAHTFTHPDFRDMNEEQQIIEAKNSIDDLARRFKLDYKVFSFPFTDFGIKQSFYETLQTQKISSLTFGCAGIKEDVSPISLQRIPVETYSEDLPKALKKEYLYHSFLKMMGKAKMSR